MKNVLPCSVVLLMWSGLGCSLAGAQAAGNRISRAIDAAPAVALRGTVSPLATARHEVGRLDGGTRISGMTLRFALSAEQKAELDALVTAQQTPGSAYYHQWLTPEEYASRFGLSDSDLASVTSWLEQRGFAVERVANSRTSITFSGTAAQVETAFQTEMHRYGLNGETHFANATQISMPAALAGVVQSVENLNDFRPKAHVRYRAAETARVQPNYTSSQSGNHYLTPKDVATIYNVNAAYNSGYDGTGQSIAVVGQSSVVASDIEAFQSAAGLTKKDPKMVLVPSSGTAAVVSGDEAESDLDLEYTGGIAKGATIYFVYVGNNSNYSVWDSIAYAVDTRLAPIISVSYGACETELSSSSFASLEAVMQQGASQGQSIIVSSGDDGSTGCYSDTSLTTAQRQALVVDYPASSAYVTALGGTEFSSSDVASSNTTYWDSASGSDVVSSAKSYIPEIVWNDDSSSSGLSSSGGGVSVWTTRPSWQAGVTGIPSGSYRLVPDISLASSPSNPGYLYCSSDSSTGITGSCTNGFRDANSAYLTVAGGTSFAAPVFAGMLAILNQKENSTGQGLINSTLYTLASNATTYASVFHDITSGSNKCTAGSSYCSSSGASQYAATAGYDQATGLGSFDFSKLVSAWPASSSAGLTATATTLSAATSTPAAGASDTITIQVTSQSSSVTTTPTGTVSVAVDGTTVSSSLALSAGVATYAFSSSTSGAHVITATYSGDSIYAASSGSTTVTIGSTSTGGSGGSGSTTVTVTPSGGYTGTVGVTLSTASAYIQNYACYNVSSLSVSGTSAVSGTLTIYTGTANCSSAAIKSGTVRSFKAAAAASSGSASRVMATSTGYGAAGLALAGLVGLGARRRRRVGSILGAVALLVVAAAIAGCGGSNSTSSSSASATKGFTVAVSPATVTVTAGTSGIPTGTYSLTVTGKDSSDTSYTGSATLSLVVQ